MWVVCWVDERAVTKVDVKVGQTVYSQAGVLVATKVVWMVAKWVEPPADVMAASRVGDLVVLWVCKLLIQAHVAYPPY